MKKLLLILFVFISFGGFCQTFPNQPSQGNGNTNNNFDGTVTGKKGIGAGSGLADTAAINALSFTKNTPLIIVTTQDNKIWLRNQTATKWLQVNGGSAGGSVDSVTSTKISCLDIQKYWIAGTPVSYDTIQLFDGIVHSGTIVESSPNHFKVTPYSYRINCLKYTTPIGDTTLITNGFDTLPRFYTVAGNTSNQAVLLVGDESLNPTPPPVNSQQIVLGFILETSTGDSIIIAPTIRYVSRVNRDTAVGPIVVLDTLFVGRQFGEVTVSPPGSPLALIGLVRDTITLSSVKVGMYHKILGTTGNSNPKFSEVVTASTGISPIRFGADGVVAFWNGIAMAANATVQAAQTITLQGNSSTMVSIPNLIGPSFSGTHLDISNGNFTAPAGTSLINGVGDIASNVLKVLTSGTIGINNATPNKYSYTDWGGVGRGLLFPRMNTIQRTGIPQGVATLTIVNPGAGMLSAPSLSITPPGGGEPVRLSCTISGGAINATFITFPGTTYNAGGSVNVDTTGTHATVKPILTYTVATGTIPFGLIIINTDSTSCPLEQWNGSTWLSICNGGGSGVSQDWQSTLNVSSNLTQDNTIDAGGFSFWINNALRQNFWTVDASGDNTVRLDLLPGIGATTSLSKATTDGVTGLNLQDTLSLISTSNTATGGGANFTVLPSRIQFDRGTDTTFIEIDKLPIISNPIYNVTMRGDSLFRTAYSGGGGSGVSSFSAGTTGFTPSTGTTGAVTLSGTLIGANGGTGVANTGKTITLGGNLTTSGAFATTLTSTATTSITLPTTGTLSTLAGTETLSNKTLVAPALGTPISGTLTNATGLPLSTGVTGILPVANISGTATNGYVATVVSGVATWQPVSSGTLDTLRLNSQQLSVSTIRAGNDTVNIVGSPTGVFFADTDSSMKTRADRFYYDEANKMFLLGFDSNTGLITADATNDIYTFGNEANARDYLKFDGIGNTATVAGASDGSTPLFLKLNNYTTATNGSILNLKDNTTGETQYDDQVVSDRGSQTVTLNTTNGTILSNPQTTGINLGAGDFTVINPGTFFIASGDPTNNFILPDPTISLRNSIHVYVSVEAGETANLTCVGGNDIYNKNGSAIITTMVGGVLGYSQYNFHTVNGHWVED